MSRRNSSEHSLDYSNVIKKSNELSMAKLNQGLTLNQMQLLAYAIFSIQQNGKTEFRKYEFQNKFGVKNYKTKDAYEDSDKVSALRFSTQDLENKKFNFINLFRSIQYDAGLFTFKWNEDIFPHILELKEKYVMMDLTITSNFKSSFSWILYDYLKAHYGYWHKELSKEAMMRLFSVEDRKSYEKSTALFKNSVLDKAISEINEFTELKVWYTQVKTGNKITRFKLHWSTGRRIAGATEKQLTLLREVHDEVERNLFEYMSLRDINNVEKARVNIQKVKEINQQVDDNLTSEKAKELIYEMRILYGQLQQLLNSDGTGRDTSVYFDWINAE